MTDYWPSVLVPSEERWQLQNASRSGGVTLTGTEQIVSTSAGRWSASLTVPIRSDEQILAARALFASLDGRAGTVFVAPCDLRRVRWPVDAYGRRITPRTYSPRYLDGTIYERDRRALAFDLVQAKTGGARALGATTLAVEMVAGPFPKAGNYLGINFVLHVITAVAIVTPTFAYCTIRPPLRYAVPDDYPLNLVQPVCTMRLASDDTGALALELARFGRFTADLVEVI